MQLMVFLFFTYMKIIAAAVLCGCAAGGLLIAAVLTAYIRIKRREKID